MFEAGQALNVFIARVEVGQGRQIDRGKRLPVRDIQGLPHRLLQIGVGEHNGVGGFSRGAIGFVVGLAVGLAIGFVVGLAIGLGAIGVFYRPLPARLGAIGDGLGLGTIGVGGLGAIGAFYRLLPVSRDVSLVVQEFAQGTGGFACRTRGDRRGVPFRTAHPSPDDAQKDEPKQGFYRFQQ